MRLQALPLSSWPRLLYVGILRIMHQRALGYMGTCRSVQATTMKAIEFSIIKSYYSQLRNADWDALFRGRHVSVFPETIDTH